MSKPDPAPFKVPAKDAIVGESYRSLYDPEAKKQHQVRMWRVFKMEKVPDFVVVFVPTIDKLVAIPSNYQLETDISIPSSKMSEDELRQFNNVMTQKFLRDFPNLAYLLRTEKAKSKEDVKMTEAAPETKTDKELRKELRNKIATLKSQRKDLSKKNESIKEQLEGIKTRADRKPLISQIKENVALRKTLSDEIKTAATQLRESKSK